MEQMGPNKGRLKLWLDALVSGEFKQGPNSLWNKSQNTYCCLGVACVVSERNGGPNQNTLGMSYGNSFPNADVQEWFGTPLNVALGFGIPCCEYGTCEEMNTARPSVVNDMPDPWTFVQIAEKLAEIWDIEITYPEKANASGSEG